MSIEFAAIDFETTGYERGEKNDPWQLGLALVDSSGAVTETREWFFKSSVRPKAETFMNQWEEFFPLLFGRRLVAHNISTERTILTRIAPLTKWGPWVDTLKIAKQKYPRLRSYALCDLCALFGVRPDLPGRTWHDALYDAIACAQLAIKLKAV
jgi:DNA polymerase III epsilon subunit-like protein